MANRILDTKTFKGKTDIRDAAAWSAAIVAQYRRAYEAEGAEVLDDGRHGFRTSGGDFVKAVETFVDADDLYAGIKVTIEGSW